MTYDDVGWIDHTLEFSLEIFLDCPILISIIGAWIQVGSNHNCS